MSTKLKYIIIGLMVLILGVIAAVIYRMFFQFNIKEVNIYAREHAAKYGSQSDAAYTTIMDAVEYILSSHNLTQQVTRMARATGTDVEQELVNAAINQSIAFGYLEK
jgi:hemoglobin-like flavoprotein